MLSCIQPQTSSNRHALWLIVLDLAQQQPGSGFRFLAFSCPSHDDALGFRRLTSVVVARGGNHGPIRDSRPIAFWGCPRGHRVGPETRCRSTQSLNFRWILSLEPEHLKKSDGTSLGMIPAAERTLRRDVQTDTCRFSCWASKHTPFFQTSKVIVAILRANVRRAIVGFIPLASNAV